MTVKFWDRSDFLNDDERVAHMRRAHEHYRDLFFCHFWLLGDGARDTTLVLTPQRVNLSLEQRAGERKRAEALRKRYRWSTETVRSEHERFSRDPLFRHDFQLCDPAHWQPPPTIEADWEPSYSHSNDLQPVVENLVE